jgi:hypothetical protein
MRSELVALVAAPLLGLVATPAAARQAVVSDAVEMRAGPGPKYATVRALPARAAIEVAGCRPSWCRVSHRGTLGYVAAAAVAYLPARPVEAPMLPPLGGYVWQSDEPPLFDPYTAAGPWYTGPWRYEGAAAAQWRYGFPGGRVAWYRHMFWRPGFGWF